MRKVSYGGAISLDGYLARTDHSVDWILWSEEAAAFLASYWRTVDTVLMGRKTYEAALALGGGGGTSGVATYVFSRTLPSGPAGDVTVVAEDAAGFVRSLKEGEGKGICLMGGGELARSLFEAGLIDEIGFTIHPVLLGSGVPALPAMGRQIDLHVTSCEAFRNGCVRVGYRVKCGEPADPSGESRAVIAG